MSYTSTLDQLETKYYGELEENTDSILPELRELHHTSLQNEGEDFLDEVINRFGGAYIPYLFWVELAEFAKNNERRNYLFKIFEAFVNSGFEEEEKKKMKPLIITYFSMEKEFEIDKIWTVIIEKAHPEVQEYFQKLLDFAELNEKSRDMYIEKFNMLKDREPDFELLRLPVIKLKQRLEEA